MKNSQNCTSAQERMPPPPAHPLELIPLFRRWPRSLPRDLLYTLIWSSGMGLAFAALELGLVRHVGLDTLELWPLLLMANLIGILIHAAMTKVRA